MTRVQALVQLTEDLLDRLDRRAESLGMSRSRLIRELLEKSLAEEAEEEGSRLLVEGYRRMPQSEGRDAWGDLDSWAEVAARRNLGALGDEEEERW